MRPRKYDMSDVWFLFAVGLPFVCILALILRFGNHTGLSILSWGLLILLYYIPAGIAYLRRHRQRLTILILNLLGGWSGIGWLAAIVWACTSDETTYRR